MLRDKDAIATIAVRDLVPARKFYADTLGLAAVDTEGEEVIVFRSGNSTINVYRSQYAGTNKATALTWRVGEGIDSVAKGLKAKGVQFEHYDLPGLREKEISIPAAASESRGSRTPTATS
jgi:catechol 2,3-dioxygenase-like lactoylglutathione lyase family enzyme